MDHLKTPMDQSATIAQNLTVVTGAYKGRRVRQTEGAVSGQCRAGSSRVVVQAGR